MLLCLNTDAGYKRAHICPICEGVQGFFATLNQDAGCHSVYYPIRDKFSQDPYQLVAKVLRRTIIGRVGTRAIAYT